MGKYIQYSEALRNRVPADQHTLLKNMPGEAEIRKQAAVRSNANLDRVAKAYVDYRAQYAGRRNTLLDKDYAAALAEFEAQKKTKLPVAPKVDTPKVASVGNNYAAIVEVATYAELELLPVPTIAFCREDQKSYKVVDGSYYGDTKPSVVICELFSCGEAEFVTARSTPVMPTAPGTESTEDRRLRSMAVAYTTTAYEGVADGSISVPSCQGIRDEQSVYLLKENSVPGLWVHQARAKRNPTDFVPFGYVVTAEDAPQFATSIRCSVYPTSIPRLRRIMSREWFFDSTLQTDRPANPLTVPYDEDGNLLSSIVGETIALYKPLYDRPVRIENLTMSVEYPNKARPEGLVYRVATDYTWPCPITLPYGVTFFATGDEQYFIPTRMPAIVLTPCEAFGDPLGRSSFLAYRGDFIATKLESPVKRNGTWYPVHYFGPLGLDATSPYTKLNPTKNTKSGDRVSFLGSSSIETITNVAREPNWYDIEHYCKTFTTDGSFDPGAHTDYVAKPSIGFGPVQTDNPVCYVWQEPPFKQFGDFAPHMFMPQWTIANPVIGGTDTGYPLHITELRGDQLILAGDLPCAIPAGTRIPLYTSVENNVVLFKYWDVNLAAAKYERHLALAAEDFQASYTRVVSLMRDWFGYSPGPGVWITGEYERLEGDAGLEVIAGGWKDNCKLPTPRTGYSELGSTAAEVSRNFPLYRDALLHMIEEQAEPAITQLSYMPLLTYN